LVQTRTQFAAALAADSAPAELTAELTAIDAVANDVDDADDGTNGLRALTVLESVGAPARCAYDVNLLAEDASVLLRQEGRVDLVRSVVIVRAIKAGDLDFLGISAIANGCF
jgi:hypothetical protein